MKTVKIIMRICVVAVPAAAALALIVLGAANIGKFVNERKAEAAEVEQGAQGETGENPNPIPAGIRKSLDFEKAVEWKGKLVQTLDDGTRVTYSLHPTYQKRAEKILDASDAVAGALVLVEVKTGRLLAMADLRSPEYAEEPGPVYFSAAPPAASLFKIVTASALLDKDAADAETSVCYHGGSSKLLESNLEDDPGRDKTCASLALAMGKSLNCVFAKLADRNLSVEDLETAGKRFGFDKKIPLQYRLEPQVSDMNIPSERLEFARTAAGFWNVHVTPLHAAMIAQAVANDGRMVEPVLVDTIESAKGKVLWASKTRHLMQCTDSDDSHDLTQMLVETVSKGTARKHFVDPKGTPYLSDIDVAGKTGSLSQKTPFRFYSWFIGFAPAWEPEVAVAALAVNGQQWKMKGATLARELLRWYFGKIYGKKK
jgi:cell division protein FtsI/penicillin-binding protein 2